METCNLCGKSIEELAKESPGSRTITLESKLFAPVNLCEDHEQLLHWVVCKELENLGIVKFDKMIGEFVATKKSK